METTNLSSRRRCLQRLGFGAGAAAFGAHPLAGLAASAEQIDQSSALARKRLIMFAWYGGNDGLNTCVPYRDPLYRRLRPALGLDIRTLMPLNDDVALHSDLRHFMAMYQAGEVAVIQDVGYPEPNLSHFESGAIWESAELRRSARSAGWLGETLMQNRQAFDTAHFDAAAISFDKNTGFAAGTDVPIYVARQNLADTLGSPDIGIAASVGRDAPAVASRLAAIVNEGRGVRERFAARLRNIAPPKWMPEDDPLEVRIKLTDWFIAHRVAAPVIRLTQDGFDTHSGQIERQSALFKRFDNSLAQLRDRLTATGVWDDTVVLVHSEFGRRAGENGYGGTDHGTSGPVFLIGGKVRGGVYGQRARLDDLDGEGNLKFTTDFRRVYATVVDRLWGLPVNPFAAAGHAALDIPLA